MITLQFCVIAISLNFVLTYPSLRAVKPENNVNEIYVKDIGFYFTPKNQDGRKIIDLVSAKKYEEALTYLEDSYKGIAFYDGSFLRGFCYLEIGEIQKAIQVLELVSGGNRNYKYFYIEALLSSNEEKERKRSKSKMEDLASFDLQELGKHLCVRKKFNLALSCFSKALIKDPLTRLQCHIARGTCYVHMGDIDLSRNEFKQAVAFERKGSYDPIMDEEASQALFVAALFEIGVYERALKELSHLKETPTNAAIGKIFEKDKKYEEAESFYTVAIEKHPKIGSFYEKRGYNYWKMEKYDKAISDFTQAVNHSMSTVDHWITLIEAKVVRDRYAEAKKDLLRFDNHVLKMNNSQLTRLESLRVEILEVDMEIEQKKQDEDQER